MERRSGRKWRLICKKISNRMRDAETEKQKTKSRTEVHFGGLFGNRIALICFPCMGAQRKMHVSRGTVYVVCYQ